MKRILYILFISFMVVLISCEDDKPPVEVYDVTITYIEPGDGAVFSSGDELHMEIDFEREGTIPYIDVLALNETTGDTIFYSGEINANATDYYAFHDHVDLTAAVVSNCKVIASSWEDPSEKISEEVSFTINP